VNLLECFSVLCCAFQCGHGWKTWYIYRYDRLDPKLITSFKPEAGRVEQSVQGQAGMTHRDPESAAQTHLGGVAPQRAAHQHSSRASTIEIHLAEKAYRDRRGLQMLRLSILRSIQLRQQVLLHQDVRWILSQQLQIDSPQSLCGPLCVHSFKFDPLVDVYSRCRFRQLALKIPS
jgi:hypothetical protein